MQSSLADPVLLNHFTIAIYPFLHTLSGPNRIESLENVETRWDPWWARLTDEETDAALEDSTFFLPYVRGMLFPETASFRAEASGERHNHQVRKLRRAVT